MPSINFNGLYSRGQSFIQNDAIEEKPVEDEPGNGEDFEERLKCIQKDIEDPKQNEGII